MGGISPYSDHLRFIPYVEINVLNLVDAEVGELEKNLEAIPNQIILKYGGMANGVVQMVSDIRREAKPGGLKVLRIWSHGYPGGQAVSVGPGVNTAGQRAGISMSSYFDLSPALAQLTPYFARGGRAELHGCNFSGGYDGIDLLTALARLWQVDVYAAMSKQPIGPAEWSGQVTRVTPKGQHFPTSGKAVGE